MKYKEFGDKKHPTIILLHGGGLSWWAFKNIVRFLQTEYYIVTPIIDGHGEDGDMPFISIQDCAKKLLRYIDENFGGKVFALGGLSLGAQIAVELLSQRTDVAQYAIIESALVVPDAGTTCFTVMAYKLLYGLIRQRWFARIQAKVLCIQEEMFTQYYEDSLNISRESLINIAISNASYAAPGTLKNTKAKALIIIGSKEIRRMDKSVRKMMNAIPASQVCIAPGMRHGEFGLGYHTEYLALFKRLMA